MIDGESAGPLVNSSIVDKIIELLQNKNDSADIEDIEDRNSDISEDNTESDNDKEKKESNVTTLDSLQAMCLPLGASFSLLIMFFFFDSMQLLFAVCTAVIATVALAFLLLPMCQYLVRPCNSSKGKISLGMCGRFTLAELLSVAISICVVCVWILTGHWALMDFMGMGLCVAFIAFVRLPSLKVSTLLLTGLLLYDVFWVFFSQVITTLLTFSILSWCP